MSRAAEVTVAAAPLQVWAVLADIASWPSWSPTFLSVRTEEPHEPPREANLGATGSEVETLQPAYRVEQPPLPQALWTVTSWRPERSFSWQTRGTSSVLRAEFTVTGQVGTTNVTYDLRWSGPTAWMARATYGPISLRYADEHLSALARRCERKPGGSEL